MKILSDQIIPARSPDRNGLVGYFTVEIWGILKQMRGYAEALAHFGGFRRTENGTLLYTATVWATNGEISHCYDSEFADDLIALRTGNVDFE